ncbi:ARM repeat-containing protein [Astrocystis sublimbata]|nr:ARM repeat-containing protein [Astrocystis sublimbata]
MENTQGSVNGFPNRLGRTPNNDVHGQQRSGSTTNGQWPFSQPWPSFAAPNGSHRGAVESRVLDEVSPTAPTSFAQPNVRAEQAPWSGRSLAWSTATSAEIAAPTNTQRHSRPQTSLNVPTALPVLNTNLNSVDVAGSSPYSASATYQHAGFSRRNSTDPSSISIGQNRTGALPSRQSEISTPSIWGYVNPQSQRASIAGASGRTPSGNTTVPFNGVASPAELEEAFERSLLLDDTTRSLYSNGHRDSMINRSLAENTFQAWPPRLNSPRAQSRAIDTRVDVWGRQGSVTQSANLSHNHERLHTQLPPSYQTYLCQPFQHASLAHDHSPGGQTHGYHPSMGQPANGQMLPGYSFATNHTSDPTQGARSALLMDFRKNTNTHSNYELADIYNHVVEFSGDQHGSRFIQDKLQVANSEEKQHIFQELMDNAVQLMKDVFGNYVIQMFFEHGDQVQKKVLANLMQGKIVDLSVQQYSCRVVQKALEHVLRDQQEAIVNELEPEIVHVSKDKNGNHVVQKVVQMFPRLAIPFIMKAFRGQIEHLATHQYACRVIQRILEHGTDDERRRLLDNIHVCATKLITDQYGNYVIQHVIQHGEPIDREALIRQVLTKTSFYSKHKYASNVVEKCIEFGTPDQRRKIQFDLTAQTSDGTQPLRELIKDQFGNYVVQKLLGHIEGQEQQSFAKDLYVYVLQLKRQSNGRQNSAIDRLYQALMRVIGAAPSIRDANGSAAAPSTPDLGVEVGSAAPTPPLTTEQNTPQSSSPPSTNISTADEASEETDKSQVSPPERTRVPEGVSD